MDFITKALYNEFVQQTGCANSTNTFACLVSVPEGELEGANVNINEDGFFGVFVLVPVIDGDFIVESPTATIQKGTLNGVCLRPLQMRYLSNNKFHAGSIPRNDKPI